MCHPLPAPAWEMLPAVLKPTLGRPFHPSTITQGSELLHTKEVCSTQSSNSAHSGFETSVKSFPLVFPLTFFPAPEISPWHWTSILWFLSHTKHLWLGKMHPPRALPSAHPAVSSTGHSSRINGGNLFSYIRGRTTLFQGSFVPASSLKLFYFFPFKNSWLIKTRFF